MRQETKNTWFRGWWPVVLLAAFSVVSLLLFYFPRQPQDLVALTEAGNRCEWTGKREVFPLSGLLLGMGYSCMELYGQPAEFYTDFQMPHLWGEDSVRLWISKGDCDKLQQAKSEASDERHKIKAYRMDVRDPYVGWQRYVAQHPHGPGTSFALGALAGILCFVLLIKKVFYS